MPVRLHLRFPHGHREQTGPRRGHGPCHLAADRILAVITKKPPVGQKIIDPIPAVQVRAVVKTKSIEIPSTTQLQPARQILEFPKPFLKHSIIIVRILVLPVPVVRSVSLKILADPGRQAELKTLNCPTILHRIMMPGPQLMTTL